MSLLQFEDAVMPFTFADVLILRYKNSLKGFSGSHTGRKM